MFRLISDKVHLATKKITEDKDEHYKMRRIDSLRWHNNPKDQCTWKQSFKIINQKLPELKGEIKYTTTFRDFMTPLSVND